MPNLYSCPTCSAVIVPQESGGACPKCRTPLPQSEIETVVPQDLPGMDDATRLAPGSGAAAETLTRHPRLAGSPPLARLTTAASSPALSSADATGSSSGSGAAEWVKCFVLTI